MTTREPDIVTVTIGYGVRRADQGGWLPVLVRNGKERWSWQMRGTDRETALEIARTGADQEAERYIGDWDVRVVEIQEG